MSEPLLSQIAAGHAPAVDQFLKAYTPAVWGLARRFCRSSQDAEEATQDVFVDLWRNAARFDPQLGNELTFVMTIARRRLIDRTRHMARRPEVAELEQPELIAEERTSDRAEQGELLVKANEALDTLRDDQRRVLQLALADGCTHQEISDRTGMPLGTVKSHARRGLVRLRELMGIRAPQEQS